MKKSLKDYDDAKLLELLKGNRKEAARAMEEIYERYSKLIYTYCVKFLNDEKIALDIFHDSFIKFYEAVKDGKQIEKINSYLARIARNMCINENKKRDNTNLQFDELLFNTENEQLNLEKKEINELLNQALERLPDEFKELIILKEFLDYKYKDIADLMDINMSLVRTRIYRAKQMLRDYLKVYINEINEIK